MADQSLMQPDRIERAILVVRGQKVILDSQLAALHGVETRRLNEQVRRNWVRFPPDFVFQLTSDEAANLISQIATSSGGHGGHRKLPFVFTEQAGLAATLKRALRPKPSRRSPATGGLELDGEVEPRVPRLFLPQRAPSM